MHISVMHRKMFWRFLGSFCSGQSTFICVGAAHLSINLIWNVQQLEFFPCNDYCVKYMTSITFYTLSQNTKNKQYILYHIFLRVCLIFIWREMCCFVPATVPRENINAHKTIYFWSTSKLIVSSLSLSGGFIPRRGDPTHFGGQALVSAGRHRNVRNAASIVDPIESKERVRRQFWSVF